MRRITIRVVRLLLIVAAAYGLDGSAKAQPLPQGAADSQPPSYNQLITVGYELIKENKLTEGYTAALHAAAIDPARFEAYALAALALHLIDANDEAQAMVTKALARAPSDKRRQVSDLAKVIAGGRVKSSAGSSRAAARTLRIADSTLGYVNVRKAPDGDAPIVGRVRPGEVYNFSTVSSGWYRIDGKGWVAGKYVLVQ